jgi:hypothetical protein
MLRRFHDRPSRRARLSRRGDMIGGIVVILIFIIIPAFVKACSQGAP